jgi:thiamine biosynthesis lipoprotein
VYLAKKGVLFSIIVVTLFCIKKKEEYKSFERSRLLMGTLFSIKVFTSRSQGLDKAISLAFKEIERIEKLMSEKDPKSQVYKINQLKGKRHLRVSREILGLIKRAKYISKITNGAFDISFKPLGDLWKKRRIPKREDLEKRLRLVDYKSIVIDFKGGVISFLKEGMQIGLGGIAKGYAIDRAKKILLSQGYRDFIISGGGDLFVSGTKRGRLFNIGIKHPRKPKGIFGYIKVSDVAVMTSGDYERFFILNGKRFHHIIDPKTGFPAKGTQSVTIIGPRAETADALGTGIFVLGPTKGMKLIESLSNIEGVIIGKRGKLLVSSGLRQRLKLVDWNIAPRI